MRLARVVTLAALAAIPIRSASSAPGTSALLATSSASTMSGFSGATFTPKVAPVPEPSLTTRTVLLQWPAVTSSKPVKYDVRRTDPNGSSVQVCTGAGSPAVASGTASCSDTTALPGVSYLYSEQPYLDIPGSTPWSLPASARSATLLTPRLSYVASGPDVSTTGATVPVPYPAGTLPGDLLLLISVSAINKTMGTPTGWTSLVSRGIPGASSVYVVISWRIADAGSSASFNPQSNGPGVSVRVVNYGRFQGNNADPVVGTSGTVSGTCSVAVTCAPTPDVITNASNSVVISIVATSAANSSTMSSPRSFTIRDTKNLPAGTGFVSLGIADTNVAAAGTTISSPVWTLSGTTMAWVFATLAFR